MPTLTTQAEEILSALENTPGLREELETYFARRWEAATGFETPRAALDARIVELESQCEENDAEYCSLQNAASALCEAIGEGRRKAEIPALVKTLKSLV